jgi:hypothetical protein
VGCYAALIDRCVPAFWDNLSIPSSKVKQPKTLEDGPNLSTPLLSTPHFEDCKLPGDVSCFLTLSKSMTIDVTLFEVLFRSTSKIPLNGYNRLYLTKHRAN